MQTTEMNFLSWFKTSDVYNPDTLATDEETIRKYYMKNGYADFRIVNTDVAYHARSERLCHHDHDRRGAAVSRLRRDRDFATRQRSNADSLKHFVLLRAGDVYNATAVDKSVEAITRELARQGYAFADVRPHGERDNANHTIALAFTVDNAPKVYIERIDIVGNTRTRDYVIRREFDIGEGDPYNHAMIEAAERRVNNLGFFKSVHISTRPGSQPDRVIVTVQVEDKPTGSISLSGGYSTTEGFLAEVAFTETNFLGRGQYVKLVGLGWPVQQRLGSDVHRALFPRSAPRGGLRRVPQGATRQPIHGLRRPDDGRESAPRRAGDQRIHVPAELFDLSRLEITIPNTPSPALRRLRTAQ